MAPNNKAKVVYVDQNKLIDLARQKNQADEQGISNSYTLLLEQVNQGNIIIPLSLTHLVETIKHKDEERRTKFAEFLGQITKGYCFAPFLIVEKYESLQAVKRWSGKQNTIFLSNGSHSFVNSGIIGKGLHFMFGQIIDIAKIPQEHMWVADFFETEKSFYDAFIRMHNTEALEKMTALETHVIEGLEDARYSSINTNDKNLFKADFCNFVLEHVIPLINDTCKKLDIVPRDLYDDLDSWEKVEQFFLGIPFVDISLSLQHDLYKQKDKPYNPNDLRDIAFLTTAIAYSDIIVTENFWAHIIKKLKLDKKYELAVFTNIDDATQSILK
jgi:hypothetical protein